MCLCLQSMSAMGCYVDAENISQGWTMSAHPQELWNSEARRILSNKVNRLNADAILHRDDLGRTWRSDDLLYVWRKDFKIADNARGIITVCHPI